MTAAGIAPFFAGWRLANDAIVTAIADLGADQLALPIRAGWPIWGSVAHLAGARVYWLCHICGEPGVETTPFTDPDRGWEDDLAHPRSAAELVSALASSWRIVERALDSWTPTTLDTTVRRPRGERVQIHTRQSILWRLITHDAFHAGEISLILGAHGLGSKSPNGAIDLWGRLARVEETRA